MPLNLVEAVAFQGPTPLEAGIAKMFEENSPILRRIPMTKIDGNTISYNQETALPGIAWRAINQTWPESTGTVNPVTERLMILGGEVKIDTFLINTQPARGPELKATQYAMKAQAASNEYDRAFFEGDDLLDPNQLVGLRRRLTGVQVPLAGVGGATLTLAMVDDLLDRVPFDSKTLFMNRTLRRKFTTLVLAQSGAPMIQMELDQAGRQVEKYGGAEIAIVERISDGVTILDFDEDPGDGVADTASLYAVHFGEGDGVHGIYNGKNGKALTVEDFGVQQAAPQIMGRLEAYLGMMIQHPRAAARLRGITNT